MTVTMVMIPTVAMIATWLVSLGFLASSVEARSYCTRALSSVKILTLPLSFPIRKLGCNFSYLVIEMIVSNSNEWELFGCTIK